MELQEELESYKRQAVIREASKDLAETQVEKLSSLAESVDFESEEAFAQKVATLKESYFGQRKQLSPSLKKKQKTMVMKPSKYPNQWHNTLMH